jgi:hypothetical protein
LFQLTSFFLFLQRNGKDGVVMSGYPVKVHARVDSQLLLLRTSARDRSLTVIFTCGDGYLYMLDGASGCVEKMDLQQIS